MIFLELVPNTIDELIESSKWAISNFDNITGINVPDILRVKNRSYDSVIPLSEQNIIAIPHIRICDFSRDDLIKLSEKLYKHNIKNILLISGDPPPNLLQPIFKHNIIEIIHILSSTFPNIRFYAGYDPYRSSLKDEYNYAKNKIKAGAKGLFTQPLFDINMVETLLNLSIDCEWFIGISPVLSQPSYNYWTTRNNVVFNREFKLDMDYNISIGKQIISICKKYNQNNYIMPIKTDINQYLKVLLNE